MTRQQHTGKKGEELAAAYLLRAGYQVLDQNYRYGKAEIDLILQRGNLLVFAEVKTRSRLDFGFPEEAVSARKVELFLMAAEEYIDRTGWQHEIRFDIIAITTNGREHQIHHIEDAFH